jgi:hypothetical protein
MSAKRSTSDLAPRSRKYRDVVLFSELCAADKLLVLVQAGALPINHIAPRRRTLAPSA